MGEDMFPDAALSTITQVSHQLEQRAEALQAQADEALRDCEIWTQLADHMRNGWSLHVLHALRQHASMIAALTAGSSELAATLAQIESIAEHSSGAATQCYPRLIGELSSERGLALDRTSRHPTYTFEGGFFKVSIDERGGTATLSDYEGTLGVMPADLEAVVQAIETEHKRVFGRPFDGMKILKRLRRQYLGVADKEGRADGDPVPIRHITRRLGKNVKGFRTDEFLIDLSRLVNMGPLEIDGRLLSLQQTKDVSQGMLLHGPAATGYVGFVVFRRAE